MTIPVLLLTGFLGSGKTTLLQQVLTDPSWQDTALIINEFGEIALDHHILRAITDETIVLLPQGCVCCQVRSDLMDTLRQLFLQRVRQQLPEFKRVIIETSGLADPLPLLQTLQADPLVSANFHLQGVITVINGEQILRQVSQHPEARKQIRVADILVINHCDTLTPTAIEAVREKLQSLNPHAPHYPTQFGQISPKILAECGHPNTDKHAIASRHWLNRPTRRPIQAQHTRQTNHGILRWQSPLAWDTIHAALNDLLLEHGERLWRLKGLVYTLEHPSQPYLVHGVGHQLYPSSRLASWGELIPQTELVCIGENLDITRLQAQLCATLAPPGGVFHE